jgi:hypothetical protein
MSSSVPTRSWTAVGSAVARHPELWATAVGQAFRLSPTGWWRRPPFLPLPDPGYVAFRVATQEGGAASASPAAGGPPDADDVVEYLRWCRSLSR